MEGSPDLLKGSISSDSGGGDVEVPGEGCAPVIRIEIRAQDQWVRKEMETEDTPTSDHLPAAAIIIPPPCLIHPCLVGEGPVSSVHRAEGAPGPFHVQSSSDGYH